MLHPCLLSPHLLAAIISSGVIETLVSALEKLGDPAGPRGGRPAPSGPGPFVEEDANDGPVSKKQTAPTATTAGAADGTGTAASVASDGAPLPPAELFFGFRRDIVAVLGNVCHDRPAAVDALMAAGGVPLMLQQCRGEEGARGTVCFSFALSRTCAPLHRPQRTPSLLKRRPVFRVAVRSLRGRLFLQGSRICASGQSGPCATSARLAKLQGASSSAELPLLTHVLHPTHLLQLHLDVHHDASPPPCQSPFTAGAK